MSDNSKQLVSKLRYQGKQYQNGNAARGGAGEKHYLLEAADTIERLEALNSATSSDVTISREQHSFALECMEECSHMATQEQINRFKAALEQNNGN